MKLNASGPQLPLDLARADGRKICASTDWPGAPGVSESHLFAAWAVLLYRYCRQEAFSLALVTPTGLVGITAELEAEQLASTALAATSASYAAALAQNATATRSPGDDRDRLEVSGATVGFAARAQAETDEALRARFDLDVLVSCTLTSSGWQLGIATHPSRYRAIQADELILRWKQAANALLGNSSASVGSLPLLNEVDAVGQRALLAGPVVAPSPRLIHEEFSAWAAATPDAPAVRFEERTWSYAELELRSNQVARWLRARAAETGDATRNVAVSLEPCPEFLACLLGIFKAGFTHVPIDPGYPEARQRVLCEDTRPLVLLTEQALLAKLEPLGVPCFTVDGDCRELASQDGAALLPEAGQPPLSPESIAYIIYTSGTTGKPKGVQISHGSLAHYLAVARSEYGYRASDVIPAMARFSFSITFFELLSPLTVGAQLLLLPRAHVLDLNRMLETLQTVTCIHASPSLWRRLVPHVREANLPASAFAQLRHISSGGDMVPPDLLEAMRVQFPAAELYVIYGCSEISCMGCTFRVPSDRPVERTQVGRAFPNMALRVLDENLNAVPEGVVGNVYFSGTGLATGYLHAPELTAEKFVTSFGERIYRTGDVGRVDRFGNLELLGRSDFQIQLRGIRLEPGEIETVLRTMSGVKDAVVNAVASEDGDKRLVAYVVPSVAGQLSARDVLNFVKRQLPDYMVPAQFVFLDQLPVNVNMKVDRRALPAPTRDNVAPLTSGVAARSDHERRLVLIWQRLLGIDGIGIDDDFFDLGGDSLRAVDMMGQIDREFGVALPVSVLLSRTTVEAIAPLLLPNAITRDPKQDVVCLRQGNGSLSVFLVHDGEGEVFLYRNLAQRLPSDASVYGILPKTDGRQPLVLTRLEEIARHYADLVERTAPSGPLLLGGLCIGGFLAFEVARALAQRGRPAPPVLLVDVAHVTTPARSVAAQRGGRFGTALKAALRSDGAWPDRALAVSGVVWSKTANTAQYLMRTAREQALRNAQVRALRWVVDRHLPIPAVLSHLSVDAVLRFAEKEYVVPEPYPGRVLLCCATVRRTTLDGTGIDDTPYRALFIDPLLGWKDKAASFSCVDIAAGHSSMLQEPYVQAVAEAAHSLLGAVARNAERQSVAAAPRASSAA